MVNMIREIEEEKKKEGYEYSRMRWYFTPFRAASINVARDHVWNLGLPRPIVLV